MLTYIPLKGPEGQVVGRVALRDTQVKLMLTQSMTGKTYLYCGGEFMVLRCDRELQLKKAPGGGKASVITVDGRRLCCWGSNEGRSAAELMFCLSQYCRNTEEAEAEPNSEQPSMGHNSPMVESASEQSEEALPTEPVPETIVPEYVTQNSPNTEPEDSPDGQADCISCTEFSETDDADADCAAAGSVELSRSRAESFAALSRRVDAVFEQIERLYEPCSVRVEMPEAKAHEPLKRTRAHEDWFARVDELTRRR